MKDKSKDTYHYYYQLTPSPPNLLAVPTRHPFLSPLAPKYTCITYDTCTQCYVRSNH